MDVEYPIFPTSGSSPRVRGTPPPRYRRLAAFRIIPACAGNSWAAKSALHSRTDHPRVCGELEGDNVQGDFVTGSSPRVRGTPEQSRPVAIPRRIIPACAGNSPCALPRLTAGTDHPRVCGELMIYFTDGKCSDGSSPRVRGTHAGLKVAIGEDRIHPRVCGELFSDPFLFCIAVGSSPRVRGTPCRNERSRQRDRIIPACAGNSWSGSARRARSSDHPRVCGELSSIPSPILSAIGSSPRVRGTLFGLTQ